MHVGELLYRIAEHGVTLRCGRVEDRLHYAPAEALPPELVAELKERKQEVIRILREDEELRRTGKNQSERQVFELAREHLVLDEIRTLRET
jgi:TubC N-terminal docking domain